MSDSASSARRALAACMVASMAALATTAPSVQGRLVGEASGQVRL